MSLKATQKYNPCDPSPCGPYSQCKEAGGQSVCSCLPNYIGIPPSCRPECVVDSSCPPNKKCRDNKCVDVCEGLCGTNARCTAVSHKGVCTCLNGYSGDPFTACYVLEDSKIYLFYLRCYVENIFLFKICSFFCFDLIFKARNIFDYHQFQFLLKHTL
jgi:hypothetical protein